MATANSVMQSTESTTDELSPTTIVLNALKKAGVPLTNENIKRYISASGRQTNEAGTDLPGLRIEAQGDEPAITRGPGVGQRGNVAKQVEGSDKSTGYSSSSPDRSTDNAANPATAATGDTEQRQRTGPTSVGDFITPAAIAAAAVGAGAIPGLMNRGSSAEFVGNAQMPTGNIMDVNPTGLSSPNPIPQLGASAGPMPDVAPPPPTSMETAMQRAIAPSGPGGLAPIAPQPQLAAPVPDPMQMIQPGAEMRGIGVNPNSVPSAAGPTTTVLPQNTQGAPRVPLRPMPPGPVRGMALPDLVQNIIRGLHL